MNPLTGVSEYMNYSYCLQKSISNKFLLVYGCLEPRQIKPLPLNAFRVLDNLVGQMQPWGSQAASVPSSASEKVREVVAVSALPVLLKCAALRCSSGLHVAVEEQ